MTAQFSGIIGSYPKPFLLYFSTSYVLLPMTHLLAEGINFFNAGRYFEAHERWEDLWRSTEGPLRLFYQGLIQAAVGLHHLSRGNLNGARAQITKSVAKLEEYPASFCQIDNEKLVSDLRQILQSGQMVPIIIVRQEKPVEESEGCS